VGVSKLKDDEDGIYKTLLESTKAIPWKIDWDSKAFTYIGPQIETLLGWTPDSWKTVTDWVERIHTDDRTRVFDFCVAQSIAGIDHEVDYRALAKDGSYVWLRDVVHVLRRPDGSVEALVGFMFDIGERKKAEEHLSQLQKQLQDFSFKDGLTGVANRRMFDTTFARSWNTARSTARPLSLIMLDLDCFKQYNDHYGHLQGDECLRRVAAALTAATTRPDGFIARYGGEEFVLLLPDTDAAGALHVAEQCRDAIQAAKLPHERSAVRPFVTASAGIGTVTPTESDDPLAFIKRVDDRLYEAKRAGKDCIKA
jgi:diguanylate cyclase (GGDEF)-like protein/PAS domain S-box-containing protein